MTDSAPQPQPGSADTPRQPPRHGAPGAIAGPIAGPIVVRPNASLAPRHALWLFGGMCAVSFGIAGGLALLGFWMVLPFAGLEMACLGAGLYVAMRDNSYREVLRVEADELHFEAGHGRPERSLRCPVAWARVHYQAPQKPLDPGAVHLLYAGEDIEVGRILGVEERRAFAARLQQWLRAAQQEAARPRAPA